MTDNCAIIDNEAARWWNTERPLTRPARLNREGGLAVKATRACTHPGGCPLPQDGRGLCSAHGKRLITTGNLGPAEVQSANAGRRMVCVADGCDAFAQPKSRRLCAEHYAQTSCAADGCEVRRVIAWGLCESHYRALRRHGKPELQKPLSMDEHRERFAGRIDRRAPDECWPWQGHVVPHGYGMFSVAGKRVYAHRFSYEMFVGPIPDGLVIDHVAARGCTRRDCVNPAHLEPVTSEENVRRAVVKLECPKCGSAYSVYPNGQRYCAPCTRARQRVSAARRKLRKAHQ